MAEGRPWSAACWRRRSLSLTRAHWHLQPRTWIDYIFIRESVYRLVNSCTRPRAPSVIHPIPSNPSIPVPSIPPISPLLLFLHACETNTSSPRPLPFPLLSSPPPDAAAATAIIIPPSLRCKSGPFIRIAIYNPLSMAPQSNTPANLLRSSIAYSLCNL